MSAGVVMGGIKLDWATLTEYEKRAELEGVHVRDYIADYLTAGAKTPLMPGQTTRNARRLTSDEKRQIVFLAAEGWTTASIARHLGCDVRTVTYHRARHRAQ